MSELDIDILSYSRDVIPDNILDDISFIGNDL